ncbi:MAG: carboxypeptidase regulatory-like domain-containing protein [Bacteroidales bacterium]|nr:carboxypeptidase regulatory-like domain-containing protein [Bacteroidales bacterium]
MDSIQKSKIGMGMVTRDYVLQNATITDSLPNFSVNFTLCQSTIIEIQAIAELQDFEKTGITESKSQLRMNLCNSAADYSRKMVAFAAFTNNAVLLQEIKISLSDLKRLAAIDLKTKGQELYDRAQSNLGELATYGIVAETQTTLKTLISEFNASIPKPRLGIDEKKQATQQLAALFKTLDTALNNMDLAIEIVRLTQVNFYNGYKTARKIIATGASTLAVKGLVKDATTGAPVKGAQVEFCREGAAMIMGKAQTGTSKIVLSKKTADKGGLLVKFLPAGRYQVTVKKVGYADVVTSIDVNDNEMCLLYVEIMKN